MLLLGAARPARAQQGPEPVELARVAPSPGTQAAGADAAAREEGRSRPAPPRRSSFSWMAGRTQRWPEAPARPDAAGVAKYFAGGAVAFGVHEAGHVLVGAVFGTSTGLRGVNFGPLPFFAITHDGDLSPRERYAVSSAGFWSQQLTSEAILSLRPDLRAEHAPLLKGMLAFDVLASVAYAGAAFAGAGPAERDTLGMAASLRAREPWVGALVLAPALLDAWRYTHPDAAWARWLSRGVKVGGVLLVIR
jgi:hypothetical protein